MNPKVTYVALGVPYRHVGNTIEFLVVKRVPEDGDFWQPITGGMEEGELSHQTIRRELLEEAGIAEPLHISEELARSEWIDEDDGSIGIDIMHAIEVHPDAIVRLAPAEHEDHRWLPLEEASALLRYDNNIESLRCAHRYASERIRGR